CSRPGTLPRTRRRAPRIPMACARALPTGRNRLTGLRLLDAVEKAHPTEPHWYLALLGVDPSRQRSGLGSALLRPVLEQCDESGAAAYLETQKPDNLAYYARFGFEERDRITVGDSPPVWLLWRDPRT
ncbi:MAG: GNAT family N-acetyltransferase, partial [Acidimicrobiia bacterium]